MTRIVCLVCTQAIEIEGFFASNSKHVVCFKINFSLENVFVIFPAFVNFDVMLCNFRA